MQIVIVSSQKNLTNRGECNVTTIYINFKFELVEIGRRQTKKANGLLAHLSFLLFLYSLINFGG